VRGRKAFLPSPSLASGLLRMFGIITYGIVMLSYVRDKNVVPFLTNLGLAIDNSVP
jgi:hypothetical protein